MAPLEDKTVKRDIDDLLGSPSALRANFVVLAGPDIGRKYPIDKTPFWIGRSSDECNVYIDDPDISRKHARVEVRADCIVIFDESTNGTFVNGNRITEHQLTNGDRVQIGGLTVLKFNFLDNLEETFNEQLYNAANKDFLTQIYNKKYFVDRFRSEFSYSRRHEVPLSLIIFDLDFFKQVNDKHGHIAGDYVLRELAAKINTTKRQEDLFARFGGEEFVVLLRGSPKETAIQIAEKFRSLIEETTFEWEGEKIPVTISVGVATLMTSNYKTHETFFRAADQQLLKAKKSGRNRVNFAQEGVSEEIKAKLGSLN